MKRTLLTLGALLWAVLAAAVPALAQAPAVIVPGPLPTLTANCTIQRNGANNDWVCSAAAAASQPLTDSAGLIADDADPSKVLFFQLSGLTTATTRTWTIPDANITFPTTIASLGANTFTGLQTFNAGFSGTTGVLSSTLGVTGVATFTAVPVFTAGITEASITDGTILARLAANETVSGAWEFANALLTHRAPAATAARFNLRADAGANAADVFWIEKADSGSVSFVNNNGSATTTYDNSGNWVFPGTVAWGVGAAISSSSNVALLAGAQTFTGKRTFSAAGGGDFIAEFTNTTAATPYTAWIREPASAASGYPLITITDNSASTTWFRVDSGTGATTFGGSVTMSAYGAGTATFDASGNITSVSDERQKDIQGAFTPGLNALMGLAPIRYRYKASTGLDTENVYAGFSAQNVRDYIPEAIGTNLDGMYSLNIVPVLAATVTAVQELAREVDELRAAAKLPAKNRTVAPVADDARVVDSATPTRLAEKAKAEEDRVKGEQERVKREAEKAAADQRAADAKKVEAACITRNQKIVKQVGKPLVCGGV